MRTTLTLGLLFITTGCGSSSSPTPCETDADCGEGTTCQSAQCVALDTGASAGGASSVPAQAALYIGVAPPVVGDSCDVSGEYTLPVDASPTAIRDNGAEDPSTGEVYRVVNGSDDTRVECTVAVASESDISIQVLLTKPRSVSFQAVGTIDASGGTIRISEWDNQTGANLAGDCVITAKVVKEGAIWATFDCPDFADGGLLSCASQGAFVFENCDK